MNDIHLAKRYCIMLSSECQQEIQKNNRTIWRARMPGGDRRREGAAFAPFSPSDGEENRPLGERAVMTFFGYFRHLSERLRVPFGYFRRGNSLFFGARSIRMGIVPFQVFLAFVGV